MSVLTTITEETRKETELALEVEAIESALEEGEIREEKATTCTVVRSRSRSKPKPSSGNEKDNGNDKGNKPRGWTTVAARTRARPVPYSKDGREPPRGSAENYKSWYTNQNQTNEGFLVPPVIGWSNPIRSAWGNVNGCSDPNRAAWTAYAQRHGAGAGSGFSRPDRSSVSVDLDSSLVELKRMSPSSYAKRTKDIKMRKVWKEVGKETLDDPSIIWLCEPLDNPEGRVKAVEELCRQACRQKGRRIVWIRMHDHNTTRAFNISRTATRTRGAEVHKVVSKCDPHITVYMGNSEAYDFEGHIFIAYSKEKPDVPDRLAEKEDRRYIKPGEEEAVCLLDRTELRREAISRRLISV